MGCCSSNQKDSTSLPTNQNQQNIPNQPNSNIQSSTNNLQTFQREQQQTNQENQQSSDYNGLKNRKLVTVDHESPSWWNDLEFDKQFYNIVLDPQCDSDSQTDWSLDAVRDKPFDQRDEISTRIHIRKSKNDMTAWKIIPRENGKYFQIMLAEDPNKLEGKNMTGWFLSLQNLLDSDKRDDDSYWPFVHMDPNVKNSQWEITPQRSGNSFRIALHTCDITVSSNMDLTNCQLTGHKQYSNKDGKSEEATYICANLSKETQGARFRLVKDMNPMRT